MPTSDARSSTNHPALRAPLQRRGIASNTFISWFMIAHGAKSDVRCHHPQAMRSIAGGVGERVPPQKTRAGRCGAGD